MNKHFVNLTVLLPPPQVSDELSQHSYKHARCNRHKTGEGAVSGDGVIGLQHPVEYEEEVSYVLELFKDGQRQECKDAVLRGLDVVQRELFKNKLFLVRAFEE